MKKISTILLKVFLVLCVLTACEKDEEDAKPKGPTYTGTRTIKFINELENSGDLDLVLDDSLFFQSVGYNKTSSNSQFSYKDSTSVKVVDHITSDTLFKKYFKLYELKSNLLLTFSKTGEKVELNFFDNTKNAPDPAFGKATVSFINLISGVSEVNYKKVGGIQLENFNGIKRLERTDYREVSAGKYSKALLVMTMIDGTEQIFGLPEFTLGGGGIYTVVLSGTPNAINQNIIEIKKADQIITWVKVINNEMRYEGKVRFYADFNLLAELSKGTTTEYIPTPANKMINLLLPNSPNNIAISGNDKPEEYYTYILNRYYKNVDESLFADATEWEDSKNFPVENKASIRFINNTYQDGTNLNPKIQPDFLLDENILFDYNMSYSRINKEIEPRNYSLKIQSNDNSLTYISKEIIFQPGALYTIILNGINTSENPLNLQIYEHKK